MKKWLKHIKFRKLFLFLSVLFIVGFVFGFLYYFSIDRTTKNSISINIITLKDNLQMYRTNNILLHVGILTALFALSFTIIGVLLIYFYLFYEGISLGFSFIFILSIYGFKGLIFYILYFIFYKLVYILILIFLILRLTRITKNTIGLLIYRGNSILKKNLSINIKKTIVLFLLVFIFDVTVYFLSLNINNLLIRFL